MSESLSRNSEEKALVLTDQIMRAVGTLAYPEPTIVSLLKAALSEKRRPMAPNVYGQDFYELCQQYRHAKEMMPYGVPNAVQAFKNLQEYITTGKLPWPSYEE